MKKCWKWILAVVLTIGVIAGILIVGGIYKATPWLPKSEKEKIDAAYRINHTMEWYDENGHKEEIDTYRYIGKYGDCYAFLEFTGSGSSEALDMFGRPYPSPYPLEGFPRVVYYPIPANVMLYHTKHDFSYADIYNSPTAGGHTRVAALKIIENREDWLTDAQLERLAQDIENLAKGRV